MPSIRLYHSLSLHYAYTVQMHILSKVAPDCIALDLLGPLLTLFSFSTLVKCLVILKAELVEVRNTLWPWNWTCLKTRVTVLKSKFLPRSFISLRNGRVIKWRPLGTTDFWLLTYYCFLWGPYEVQIKRIDGPYEVQIKRRDGPYV